MDPTPRRRPTALVVGVGEYVTGLVQDGSESTSDKPIGVVALCLFSLKQRGLIGDIVLCGRRGGRAKAIREHMRNALRKYRDLNDESLQQISYYPNCEEEEEEAVVVVVDDKSYLRAMDERCQPGDMVFVFTPDHTHHTIALSAVQRGLHVLVAKPLVQRLEHHLELTRVARQNRCICAVEVHKRWDPMYQDARERIAQFDSGDLGQFSYFHSYMSQPASQLVTFQQWASHSDISYYLNSHHIDFHCWSLTAHENSSRHPTTTTAAAAAAAAVWRPVTVYATASNGVARSEPYRLDTEDSITLLVQWHLLSQTVDADRSIDTSGSSGSDGTASSPSVVRTATASYTASWIATTNGDVHSQQRFFYQGTRGELSIDQAHRGYVLSSDNTGHRSVNPLFMKYTPDTRGNFSGHGGYGYRSLETFVQTCLRVNGGEMDVSDATHELATAESTAATLTTAILEAGRLSLDANGAVVTINYNDAMQCTLAS